MIKVWFFFWNNEICFGVCFGVWIYLNFGIWGIVLLVGSVFMLFFKLIGLFGNRGDIFVIILFLIVGFGFG